jgi:hypothetical protein
MLGVTSSRYLEHVWQKLCVSVVVTSGAFVRLRTYDSVLNVWRTQILEKKSLILLVLLRMESTEKCEAIITHFNGKYIKTPPGVPGEASGIHAESHRLFLSVKILGALRD